MPTWEKVVRVVTGLFFFGTGAFKFFGPVAPHLPPGQEGFAELLAAAGVPFPLLSAYLASLTEVMGGAVVIASAFVPRILPVSALASVALAFDMLIAMSTVGIRTFTGDYLMVRGLPTSNEGWRIPLEGALLLSSILLTYRAARQFRSGNA